MSPPAPEELESFFEGCLPSTSRILFRSDSYPIDAAIEGGFHRAICGAGALAL